MDKNRGNIKGRHSWRGKRFRVEILHSRAGLAQTIWVEQSEKAILFDTGDGALRDMLDSNLDWRKLQAIFFTHGHFDHVGGLYTLLGFLRMIGRMQKLLVGYPDGATEIPSIVKAFLSNYRKTMPFKIEFQSLEPFQKLAIDKIEIETYPMMHCGSIEKGEILDRIPAYGYRIADGIESIAISGDTGVCPELSALIRGCNLAILEATYQDSSRISPEMLRRVHLSEDIAAEIGGLAREFILIHKSGR